MSGEISAGKLKEAYNCATEAGLIGDTFLNDDMFDSESNEFAMLLLVKSRLG